MIGSFFYQANFVRFVAEASILPSSFQRVRASCNNRDAISARNGRCGKPDRILCEFSRRAALLEDFSRRWQQFWQKLVLCHYSLSVKRVVGSGHVVRQAQTSYLGARVTYKQPNVSFC